MEKQDELIYQVKNILGITALMMDYMPSQVKFHFMRVAAKLSLALCAVLETDDLRRGEIEKLATKDVLSDWQKDENAPDGLSDVLSQLMNVLDAHDEDEPTSEQLSLWADAMNDVDFDDQTDNDDPAD